MAAIGYLFPGQGSQYVGMGKELADSFPAARRVFEEADEALGFAISRLCFNGPEEELKLTRNTQPAILTVSIAALRVLTEETGLRPILLAGHSLGEYAALIAAGALQFADAVRAVRFRGQFMQEAVPPGQGAMAAIMGLEAPAVEEICREAAQGEVVAPANFNSSWQIVISGHSGAVSRAVDLALARDAKKAVMLAVSAPFHCSLMKPAAEKLAGVLADIPVAPLQVPVISNADAQPYPSADAVKPLLVKQVDHPVRWEESMGRFVSSGVKAVVEIGPGKVLTGLMKRIAKEVTTANMQGPEDLADVSRLV